MSSRLDGRSELTTSRPIRKFVQVSIILGGRPMVGLQTLDLAIGVRVPASQPIRMNKLWAASRLPVLALYHYRVTALRIASQSLWASASIPSDKSTP